MCVKNEARRTHLTLIAAQLRKLAPLVKAAGRIERGCSCRYDDRCGKCMAVVNLQQALQEFKQ